MRGKPRNKKKRIRNMRPVARLNPDGSTSSHVMAWAGDPSKRRGNFGVFPTITPKIGKENSTNPNDWKIQSAQEAIEKGEFIKLRRKRKAIKFAAGSWKKGIDKTAAMRSFRRQKDRFTKYK